MFDFRKNLKYFAGAYAVIIVAAIVALLIFGINLSIDFRGGSRFTFTYKGDIKVSTAEKLIEKTIKEKVTVTTGKTLNSNSKKLVVSLQKKDALDSDAQAELLKSLQEKFSKNDIKLGDSSTVSANIAASFFAKALVAVLIAAIFVVIYVGIRFRKIGGVSAALTALCAVVLDVCVAFATCIFFRLQIDANFIAVVLTILGYSLNDTIVTYDRVRENRAKLSGVEIGELVNTSINQVKTRTIVTTVTTVLSVITILVVSEIYGLTSLRTFTIPMMFSLISGCMSSLTIAGPLWVLWKTRKSAKAKAE